MIQRFISKIVTNHPTITRWVLRGVLECVILVGVFIGTDLIVNLFHSPYDKTIIIWSLALLYSSPALGKLIPSLLLGREFCPVCLAFDGHTEECMWVIKQKIQMLAKSLAHNPGGVTEAQRDQLRELIMLQKLSEARDKL